MATSAYGISPEFVARTTTAPLLPQPAFGAPTGQTTTITTIPQGTMMGWNTNMTLFAVFIGFALLTWLIIWMMRPVVFLNTTADGRPTNDLNAGYTLLASIAVGALAALLVWLARGC